MKVKFTAEIIDDDGNVVGKRTSEEGGIPIGANLRQKPW